MYIHTCSHIKTCPKFIILVASGEVFTWGSGSYGRLGHGNMRDRFSPLMIGGILRGVGITFIACHEFHSVAVAGERKREEEREMKREGWGERERERRGEREREREGEGGRRERGEERERDDLFHFQMEVRCSHGVRVGLTLAMSYQTVSPSSCGLRKWMLSLNRRSSMYHVENLTH